MARLCGTYKHTIDKKNRMFLPAKIRANIGEKFIAAKSLSAKCIALYPEEVWDEFYASLKELPKITGDSIRRKIFPAMEELTPDEKGRVLIPSELCKYAELDKEVVVIGVDNHAEIWSDANYAAEIENQDSPDLLAQIAALGL